MDKLDMMSRDNTQENIKKIQAMFPNAVTEVLRDGKVQLAVDFDILKQEMSTVLIGGKEERYQMTWPDKRKSILLANSPISATLRPSKEESVDFDSTENLYIEGDNLDVLKLLQETYLNKIKMIYIDPPYNTGNDFVYNDDFAESTEEYLDRSGQFDEQGNRLVQNTESNGRFHTDWLNMIYPRLKIAKDLLTDDGVIFISIDDIELSNIRKLCDETFGQSNFIAQFTRKGSGGRQDSKFYAIVHEYVLCYAKNASSFVSGKGKKEDDLYPHLDKNNGLHYKTQMLRKWGENSRRSDRPNLYYAIPDPDGNDHYPKFPNGEDSCWRWGKEKMFQALVKGYVEFRKKDGQWLSYEKIYKPTDDNYNTKLYTTVIDDISNSTGASLLKELFDGKVFNYPKPVDFIVRLLKCAGISNDDIVFDFFSGSATTAHAVMQLNIEDGGNRKFIMVQLPELCDEKSEAYKAGYKNICEIGKERIRRAGKKIKEDNDKSKEPKDLSSLDTGFRVLKLDSSNMKNVYYKPNDYEQISLDDMENNIKEGRTPLDLLFQVMLNLGKPLSSKIEEKIVAGKRVFAVSDNDLVACFDDNITDEVVKAIAELKPHHAVFRDSSFASDNVGTNFDQIFATYSPNTTRRVI